MHFSLFPPCRNRLTGALSGLLAVAAALLLPSTASAQNSTLFADEFNSPAFNAGGQWGVYGPWQFIGRTQFGLAPQIGSESGVSFARMPLRTYNDGYDPQRPALQGSEIFTQNAFKLGSGVEFEFRVRGVGLPRGVVMGVYTYSEKGRWPDGYLKEEIDFEMLTNFSTDRFWSNVWNDWNPRYGSNDGVHNSDAIVSVTGMNYTQWTTYTARWYADRVEWYVNGQLVRSSRTVVPDDPMTVHFNVWAPESGWGTAYDAGLQPTNDPAKNRVGYMDVDYVRVKQLPSPTRGAWGTGGGTGGTSGGTGGTSGSTGDGLRAQYFPQPNFGGTPVTRTEPRLFHDWKRFSPDVNIPNDNFSARWTGFVQSPFTENVTFTLRADDGVRLYLNGVLRINDWRSSSAADRSFTVAMTAGVKVPIRVEYFEGTGDASAQLSWQSASMPKGAIPQSQTTSGDTAAPSVAISTPAANLTAPSVSAITGTASDGRQDNGVWSAGSLDRIAVTLKRNSDNLYFNGSTWTAAAVEAPATGLSSWNLPLPALSPGGYTVAASATDMAGNRAVTPSRTFTIASPDTTPPTLTVNTPQQYYSYTSITATGTATDSDSGVASVKATLRRVSDGLYWNGSGWGAQAPLAAQLSGTNWSLDLKFLAHGQYTLAAWATDNAGNTSATTSRDFWIDTIAPTTTITTPAPYSTHSSLSYATGTARDEGPGVASTRVRLMRTTDYFWWNGSTWSSTYAELPATTGGGPGVVDWSFSLPPLPNGGYILWAQSNDYVGNVGEWARSDFSMASVRSASSEILPRHRSF